MPPKINTATAHTPLVEAIETVIVDESAYSSKVLYPNNKDDYTFEISPGTMAVITAYSLEPDDSIEFFKVLKTSGTDQVGGGPCCPIAKKARASSVALRSKICAWELEECRPVQVVKTPGTYEIRPSSESSGATVTLDIYSLQETNDEL